MDWAWVQKSQPEVGLGWARVAWLNPNPMAYMLLALGGVEPNSLEGASDKELNALRLFGYYCEGNEYLSGYSLVVVAIQLG